MRADRCLLIVSLVLAAGCAAHKPAVPPAAVVSAAPTAVDVTALMRQGCFRCLERALAAAVGEQRFEVSALMTLRAKELGLPFADYRNQAAAAAPADPRFETYLQIVDAIPVDALAGERYLHADTGSATATRPLRDSPGAPVRLPPFAERVQAWRETIQMGPGSDLFRGYLEATLECTVPPRADQPAAASGGGTPEAPLLRYRISICGQHHDQLLAVREADADFVDADYFLARYALGARPADLDEARTRLQSARDAFPKSLAITVALGDVLQEREEWTEAVGVYEAALMQLPQHRDALLGQTISLSRLKRHDDAIQSATRMIDLGEWFVGEAYYWRAWNEFSLQQYQAARLDTDRARSRMVNAAVFILSGLVEWNLLRLPTAESEFEEALKMDFGRCDAARFLGRVRVQRSEVPEALAAFQQAIQCFDLSITLRQKLIADIQAGPGSDATKARLAAGHQRAIAEAIADRDECRQNVAALQRRGTL